MNVAPIIEIIKTRYDENAEAYKLCIKEGLKLAAEEFVERMKFYDARLAEYDL